MINKQVQVDIYIAGVAVYLEPTRETTKRFQKVFKETFKPETHQRNNFANISELKELKF